MKWNKIKDDLSIGDYIEVYTKNSVHSGFYCGITNSYIPRIVLAGSHKFIYQVEESQCYDHTFSIDIDKIQDVWINVLYSESSRRTMEAHDKLIKKETKNQKK